MVSLEMMVRGCEGGGTGDVVMKSRCELLLE